MSIHQRLADATFQVVAGQSRGSGFSFIRPELVVTNLHVVASMVDVRAGKALGFVTVITESGKKIMSEILGVNEKNDYAILQLSEPLPDGREVLQPSTNFKRDRGTKLIFAGYPHGIPQLLTSEAIVSAPLEDELFSIDGMVNGGNSGGPIVDASDCRVVGIVTQRRYMRGSEVEAIAKAAKSLINTCNNLNANIHMGGIDFAKLNRMYAESLSVIVDALDLNANSGIGIGFPIQPVTDVISKMFPQ